MSDLQGRDPERMRLFKKVQDATRKAMPWVMSERTWRTKFKREPNDRREGEG
jgi:hypothetical protein